MYKRENGRFGLSSVLECGLLLVALGVSASAQNPNSPQTPGGWNAVINSGSNSYSPTYAIVDATQYGTAGTDVCALINRELHIEWGRHRCARRHYIELPVSGKSMG